MSIFCFSVNFRVFLILQIGLLMASRVVSTPGHAQVIFKKSIALPTVGVGDTELHTDSIRNASSDSLIVPKRLLVTYLEKPSDTLFTPKTKVDSVHSVTQSDSLGSRLQLLTDNYRELRQTQFEIDSVMLLIVSDSIKQVSGKGKSVAFKPTFVDLYCTIPSIMPIRYGSAEGFRMSSGFGFRIHPISGDRRWHNGLDFPASPLTNVYSTADGIVEKVVWDPDGYGLAVLINHPSGYQSLYGHLEDHTILEGQLVVRGQVIGHVGTTGSITGPHLHYSIFVNGTAIDPFPYCFLLVNAIQQSNNAVQHGFGGGIPARGVSARKTGYKPTIQLAPELKKLIEVPVPKRY